MSDKLVADLARDFVKVLNVSGQRHASREALIFCEGVEQADASPAPAIEGPAMATESAAAPAVAPAGERLAPDKVEE